MTGTGDIVRIAMWSGPRNISTALMRSFGNRPDTTVVDEPFYAAYLAATDLDHPMRDQVIAAGDTDAARVAARLADAPAGDARVFYQKHMTHHMLPQFPRDWTFGVTNAFLIRRPEDVVASYAAKRADVCFADLGFDQQGEIFDAVADRIGAPPPVVDASDVLGDPARVLGALCTACGIVFSQRMLRWPAGPRPTDGVWAAHWYGKVEQSTGFAPPRPPAAALPGSLARLAERARPIYERLHRVRLTG